MNPRFNRQFNKLGLAYVLELEDGSRSRYLRQQDVIHITLHQSCVSHIEVCTKNSAHPTARIFPHYPFREIETLVQRARRKAVKVLST